MLNWPIDFKHGMIIVIPRRLVMYEESVATLSAFLENILYTISLTYDFKVECFTGSFFNT